MATYRSYSDAAAMLPTKLLRSEISFFWRTSCAGDFVFCQCYQKLQQKNCLWIFGEVLEKNLEKCEKILENLYGIYIGKGFGNCKLSINFWTEFRENCGKFAQVLRKSLDAEKIHVWGTKWKGRVWRLNQDRERRASTMRAWEIFDRKFHIKFYFST